jgi:hypothetical protein
VLDPDVGDDRLDSREDASLDEQSVVLYLKAPDGIPKPGDDRPNDCLDDSECDHAWKKELRWVRPETASRDNQHDTDEKPADERPAKQRQADPDDANPRVESFHVYRNERYENKAWDTDPQIENVKTGNRDIRWRSNDCARHDIGVEAESTSLSLDSVCRRPEVVNLKQIGLQAASVAVFVRTLVVPSVLCRVGLPEPIATRLAEELAFLARVPV